MKIEKVYRTNYTLSSVNPYTKVRDIIFTQNYMNYNEREKEYNHFYNKKRKKEKGKYDKKINNFKIYNKNKKIINQINNNGMFFDYKI